MTTRPRGALSFDSTVLRIVVHEGNQNLGLGAHERQVGELRIGADVFLDD